MVVADGVHHLHRLLEVGLRLTGEADDDVGGEGDAGDGRADPLDQAQVALGAVGAAHRLQHAGGAGLQRQVQVLADGLALGHGCDHVVAHVLRVRAGETDARDPVHRVQVAEQTAEPGSLPGGQVAPPGVDVLAQQRQLADAVGGQPARLPDQVVQRPALLAAAHAGNDAVAALRVAALRDLQPGLVAALALAGQVAGEVVEGREVALGQLAAGGDVVAQLVDGARAERQVDERVEVEQLLLHRLRPAAADHDPLLRVALLGRARLHQVRHESLVGLLTDRAGVEHQHVGLALIPRFSHSQRLQQALDPLGIVHVHLAAEGLDVVALHAPECIRGAA